MMGAQEKKTTCSLEVVLGEIASSGEIASAPAVVTAAFPGDIFVEFVFFQLSQQR